MEISKDVRPYLCRVCNVGFKGKQFLQRHMASHSEERNYSCGHCGKSYKYRKGLNRHIKKHQHAGEGLILPLKKEFKVEDYLDLALEDKFLTKKIWDPIKKEEIEVLFTWRCKESNIN